MKFRLDKIPGCLLGTLAMFLGLCSAAYADVGPVIVELNTPPAARWVAQQRHDGFTVTDQQLADYRAGLADQQDQFLQALADRGIMYDVKTVDVANPDGSVTPINLRYTLVLDAVTLNLSGGDVDYLQSMPQVKAVHRDQILHPKLDHSVPYIHAPQVYGQVQELTAYDDLREGYEGQGVKIAVIDTGIDWSHEMFGGDATPPRLGLQPETAALNNNAKVIYYLPLADAMEDTFGHGTHVSSTAAGYQGFAPGPDGLPNTGDDVAEHGVAPQARLMGYQVCNGEGAAGALAGVGTCFTSTITLALEDAVSPRTLNGYPKPVADVINMSLGGAGGPDDTTSVAADNAALMGSIVVAAAGNEGPGEGTVGSPASGRHVIAVAASNDPGVYPNSVSVLDMDGSGKLSGSPTIIANFAADSNAKQSYTQAVTGHYVYAGLADTPDQVPVTVLGNICLVKRGSTIEAGGEGTGLFANKAANCEAKGATAVVIMNDEPGQLGAVLAPAGIPVFTIDRADGRYLRDDLGFDGATGTSRYPIRLDTAQADLFRAQMAGFSSRGPVQGLGQVKPDVTAPGTQIMAATTFLGEPVVSMQSATRYIEASGTSMASPHVAGAAALVHQAHPTWTPDMVRTALINTATNLRDPAGTPAANGNSSASIIAQGGGLIDVYQAVNARALMGVVGDGINEPGILGSHSFGAVPVVNSRVLHTESVTVTIHDVSGDGGTYQLAIANNRELQRNGIYAETHPSNISVPANGVASFTLDLAVDGDQVRDAMASQGDGPLEIQGYLRAVRSDGAERLRMPFYMQATPSVPAQIVASERQTFNDTLPASDVGQQLVEGVTYNDYPLDLDSAVFQLRADLEFGELVDATAPDLDLYLLNPAGDVIASSANGGGPESLSARITAPGTYTLRVAGWLSAATSYQLTAIRDLGGAAPQLAAIPGDFLGSDGVPVDFDGDFTLQWSDSGNASRYEVQRATTDGGFQTIAIVDGGTQTLSLNNQPEGSDRYRVIALFPGKIGYYVAPPSNISSVDVSPRHQVNITGKVDSSLANPSFDGQNFAIDLSYANSSEHNYLPLVEMRVIRIHSASGTVRVANADNGGAGTSPKSAALFDYSHAIGTDDVFEAGETTDSRHLVFADPAAELFSFDARVTAYVSDGTGSTGKTSSTGTGASTGSTGSSTLSDELVRVTVNPLTGEIQTQSITDSL